MGKLACHKRRCIIVMPDLIRHPVFFWLTAFAGMTISKYTTRKMPLEV